MNAENIIQSVVLEVENFNESIRQTLDEKNINNTREAANSLRVQYGTDFVRSIGIFYLEFLDRGRYPGSYAPFNPISKWVSTKLGITDEKENKQATYAIIKKIHNLGTKIYRDNRNGIELDDKILELKIAVNESIKSSIKIEITRRLDEFKKIYESKKLTI